MGVLAVLPSKASKRARLVEKKLCFISGAGNWRGFIILDRCILVI